MFSSYSRFGFNGKEKDVNGEWGENTTNYDYGFRIYNPSIGKFLSVDPLTKSYAELTPYQFASNSPIANVDLDGLEQFYAADGTYIDASSELMVVGNAKIAWLAKRWLENGNPNSFKLALLTSNSRQVYKGTDENEKLLLGEWAKTQKADMSWTHELTMSIFEKEFVDENGDTFDVIVDGTTEVGPEKDRYGGAKVDLLSSKINVGGADLENFGWKRKSVIHTHPSSGGFGGNHQNFLMKEVCGVVLKEIFQQELNMMLIFY